MYRSTHPALEMIGITRTFPGVIANHEVNFSLQKGEIHALLGENGAGKTTLMKIAYGMVLPQKGEIRVFGKPVRMKNASHAISLGIGMVHQHFTLVPRMTAAENIILGKEVFRFGPFLNRRTAKKNIGKLSRKFGMKIDPDARIETMPIGMRQRVEILKVLFRDAKILILDEPTTVLTPIETEKLFFALQELKNRGASVVFITHKLEEVKRTADRITVLRKGRSIQTMNSRETSKAELASLMVGKHISPCLFKKAPPADRPVLRVKNLTVQDDRGAAAVQSASFQVHEREILGIAGVQGNGQTELAEALSGLRKSTGGEIFLDEEEITNCSPRRLLESGIAHIPEDRHKYGLVKNFSIAENLVLTSYYQKPFSHRGVLQYEKIYRNARRLMELFNIRAPEIFAKAGGLSGGNQQKLAVAREISKPIRLLIAAYPTRGIDVGAAEFIRERLLQISEKHYAVLLISNQLDELFALSDRIAVMHRGKFLAIEARKNFDRKKIGLLMAGIV